MDLTLSSGRSVAALLAVWATLTGCPAAFCVAMPDCPAMAPASDCHAAAGMKPRVEPSVFCVCGMAAPPSSSDSDSSATAARLALDAPLPGIVPAPSSLERPAALTPLSGRLRPYGRSLLSLHRTRRL